jgi:ATP-dependent DNA helicase RecG
METPAKIRDILSKGASAHLDFKPSETGLDTLGESICALLNSGGGQIVVGVREDGEFEGEVSAKKLENKLQALSGGAEPGGLIVPNAVWDVTEECMESGSVAIIDVPAGADTPYVFRDAIFIRSGHCTREATKADTRTLIEKRYLRGARWERQPATQVTLQDLDEEEILKTAKIASSKRGWRFDQPDDPRSVLQNLNLIHQGRLTNAAVILFAKQAGHIYPQAQVRATVFGSDKTAATLVDDQVFSGHLFANLESYDSFVARHVQIASDFTAGRTERDDRPMYPYWPLREGFRNALMHRDYISYHGRVTVSFYPKRLEIWSFGDLPKGLTIASLRRADRSLPVNPDIAQVVFLRGLVDLLGRGTRKIVEEFRSLGLPEPTWNKQAGGITLILQGGHASREMPSDLNSRQIDILRRLRPGASITIPELYKEAKAKISERTARNDVSQLVKLGFLSRQGRGKSTFYVRTEKPIA